MPYISEKDYKDIKAERDLYREVLEKIVNSGPCQNCEVCSLHYEAAKAATK